MFDMIAIVNQSSQAVIDAWNALFLLGLFEPIMSLMLNFTAYKSYEDCNFIVPWTVQ